MLRSSLLASVAFTTISTSSAMSQDAFDLGEIVLSGGLTGVEASEYGRAATVLDAEQIEARGADYAVDVLRGLPGISVSRAGSAGGIAQVRMRGHEGNHTLVLIDGVEVAAPNTGEYDFGGLLAADIDRIEVLRGAQSSLYGSNAIGGVISITTKRATQDGLSGQAGLEFGSDGTVQGNLALRASGARGDLSFAAQRLNTNGSDISGTAGGEDDGDTNATYALNGRYFVSDTVTVGGTLRYTDRTADNDAFNFGAATRSGLVTDSIANVETQELFGSLYLEATALGGRMENRLDLSFGALDRQGRNGSGAKDGDNSGTRRKLAYRATFALDAGTIGEARHLLTVAAETERLTYKENDASIVFGAGQLVKRSRDQEAIVLEYQGNITDALDVQASLRHDFNDAFENATTYALGLSYRLPNDTTRLHASYGTGVQNPTLIEQFGFFSDFVGNPNLSPERSKGWDIGIEQSFWGGRGLFDLTYFKEELTDEITSVFDPVAGVSTPVNQTGKSDRQGIEVAAELAATDRLDLRFSYTWLDASDPDGSIEVRRPKQEALLQLGYRMANDRTRLNLDVRHVAGLYDMDFTAPAFGGSKIRLDDYTVVNAGFSHDITDGVRLSGGVRNLFNASYQEQDGYSAPSRVAFFGVASRF